MSQYDNLLKKAHVRNHPLIAGRDHYKRARAACRKYSQMMEDTVEEEKPELNDMFSQKENENTVDGGDQKLSTLIYKASESVQDLMHQFNFPLPPALKFLAVKKVKRAATDADKVIEAEVRLEAKIETLTGSRQYLEVPVHIVKGAVIPPSMVYHDGREYLLTQTVVDKIVRRATSYSLDPLTSGWNAPPLRGAELAGQVELRNEQGYQPREYTDGFMNVKKNSRNAQVQTTEERNKQVDPRQLKLLSRKKKALRGGTPGGWKDVLELIQKAEEDGTDTFPRPYPYLCREYILELLPYAEKDAWEIPLINMGYAINPYGDNRGRKSAKSADMDKELDFEMSDKPVDAEEVMGEVDEFELMERFYEGTKTPMELEDKIKFNGNDGPIRGQIVEIDPEADYMIVKSKGLEYRVHVEDIEPMNSTFKKMYARNRGDRDFTETAEKIADELDGPESTLARVKKRHAQADGGAYKYSRRVRRKVSSSSSESVKRPYVRGVLGALGEDDLSYKDYYVLVGLAPGSSEWEVIFGDYDRDVVLDEKTDTEDSYEEWTDLRVILAPDTHAEIDDAARMLGKRTSRSSRNPRRNATSEVTYGFAISDGFNEDFSDDPASLDQEGVTHAAMKIEQNMLRWLKENIGFARDEGHDSSDDLIGTIFVASGSEAEEFINEGNQHKGAEPYSEGRGDLPFDSFEGVDDQYISLFDPALSFFGGNEESADDSLVQDEMKRLSPHGA